MSTVFKVGDKVRHIHATPTPREIVAVESNTVCVRGALECDPSLEIWVKESVALVEECMPRKRLHEYTDLAVGDVVVIAGVEWDLRGTDHCPGLYESGKCVGISSKQCLNMLVDEVRRKPRIRKPRMKKRRVYEEIDTRDKSASFATPDGRGWRLVEETEVPR